MLIRRVRGGWLGRQGILQSVADYIFRLGVKQIFHFMSIPLNQDSCQIGPIVS